jgi:transposase
MRCVAGKDRRERSAGTPIICGRRVEKDKAAVKAGLTWSINNGMVEGHVTKLKLIKRQMYGKAGFALLRKRVLHAL